MIKILATVIAIAGITTVLYYAYKAGVNFSKGNYKKNKSK